MSAQCGMKIAFYLISNAILVGDLTVDIKVNYIWFVLHLRTVCYEYFYCL